MFYEEVAAVIAGLCRFLVARPLSRNLSGRHKNVRVSVMAVVMFYNAIQYK